MVWVAGFYLGYSQGFHQIPGPWLASMLGSHQAVILSTYEIFVINMLKQYLEGYTGSVNTALSVDTVATNKHFLIYIFNPLRDPAGKLWGLWDFSIHFLYV